MFYILSGQDDFSLTQSLEEIKEDIGEQVILAASTTTLDGQQVSLDQLRTVCDTLPFLTDKRLVIIRGLLERFERRGRPRRQKKTVRITNQPDESKSFASCINKIPDSTILVLIENRIRNNNPLLRELSDKGVLKTFPLLRDAQLRQWIQRRVAEKGGSVSSQAVDLLTELVGSNLWIMASETNKLILFASDRRIEEEDVKVLVSHSQQVTVFNMVDAIIEFRPRLAEQLLQQLLQSGAAPAYLLFMLWRQIQMLVRAKELSGQRRQKTEIQNRLGLVSEFALRKTLEQANRYSLLRLKEVYHQLLETDLSMKTGTYDGELALNILVAELCQQHRVNVT